jgi:hypothetical protein
MPRCKAQERAKAGAEVEVATKRREDVRNKEREKRKGAPQLVGPLFVEFGIV